MVNASSELYNNVWTKWNDDVLIKLLDFHACWDLVRLTREDTRYFDEILEFHLSLNRRGVTSEDIAERFEILERRYHTWSSIVERDRVHYDGDLNTVTAEDEVWDSICKEFELGRVYRYGGNEHMWPELCGIFGPDSVRATRKALIKPYGQTKNNSDDELQIEDRADGSRAVDCESIQKRENPQGSEHGILMLSIPTGRVCPKPGDWINNAPISKKGESSKSDMPKKESKSKRFLHF